MKHILARIEEALEQLTKAERELRGRGTSYPDFTDIIGELQLRDCTDEEIAYWLMTCDNKLGAIPLDLIYEGNIEGVYRRLREGRDAE